MKIIGRAALLLCFLTLSGLLYADDPVTVGSYDSGNCYPFICNDSGTNVGPSIEYQQVFASTAFTGTTTINTITWYHYTVLPGDTLLGGTYNLSLGYANDGVNGLSSTLASNWAGTERLVGSLYISPGASLTAPVNRHPWLHPSPMTQPKAICCLKSMSPTRTTWVKAAATATCGPTTLARRPVAPGASPTLVASALLRGRW